MYRLACTIFHTTVRLHEKHWRYLYGLGMKIRIFTLFLVLGAISVGNAGEPISNWPETQSFVATCEAQGTRRYDHLTNLSGELVTREWSKNEKFFTDGPWEVFSYKSGDSYVHLLKTDTRAKIVARFPNLLIANHSSEGTRGISVWSYAMNLHLNEIVAAQTNASGSNGEDKDKVMAGLKARIVQLKCDFQYPRTQSEVHNDIWVQTLGFSVYIYMPVLASQFQFQF